MPVPYNHSNVMSDEVIYYASSEFMSRKGIEYGSITLHPGRHPARPAPGPHRGVARRDRTDELAVMVDTFRPLHVSRQALEIEDAEYFHSWLSYGPNFSSGVLEVVFPVVVVPLKQ